MKPNRSLSFLFLLLVPVLVLSHSVLFAAQQIAPKRVLVLASYSPTVPVADLWDKGIRSVFDTSSTPPIRIDIEHLYHHRIQDHHYRRMLVDLYHYKYSKENPDLVIALYSAALDFALKVGLDLFQDIPIIFGGVVRQSVENRTLGSNIYGIINSTSYKETLDLALTLHPNTRHVAIVAGVDFVSRQSLREAREIYRAYAKRITFIDLVGLPMADIQKEAANLPPETIVIFIMLLKDGNGKEYTVPEALSLISSASNAPIYSFQDHELGNGIVGGYLSDVESNGKAVAELGLRILKGVKPSGPPLVQKSIYQLKFDWRQLQRWSISEDRLPPGSIVKFKELTVWDDHKGQIIGALALILFQALIIFYLLYQRKIRFRAEKERLQAEQNYRTVADYTYDWEYWQNPDGSLQYISPSCERVCGYTVQDLMTSPSLLEDMIVPEDKAAWNEHKCSSQKGLKSGEIQFRIQKPDGEIRWIEHACQPVFNRQGNNQGVRASNRDITKREFYRSETHKLQSELAHMDRVVTISTLTSALAHEINQPLAAMRSYAQAALRFMDKDQPEYDSVREALQGIVADNKRAAEVVNRLRDLVKKGSTHWEPIDINSIINDVIGLINSEIILRNASIRLDLHPSVPVVQGDSIQIQQVLINLLTNAMDAMNDQPIDARTIAISTRSEDSNEIIVSISDSGGGIPSGTIKAIFSPFHTTKSTGMGLGLSICKSIIEAHGGKIYAENNPDGGAMFSLILPTGSQIK
jgi:PAS domain S-box-containing protein